MGKLIFLADYTKRKSFNDLDYEDFYEDFDLGEIINQPYFSDEELAEIGLKK